MYPALISKLISSKSFFASIRSLGNVIVISPRALTSIVIVNDFSLESNSISVTSAPLIWYSNSSISCAVISEIENAPITNNIKME